MEFVATMVDPPRHVDLPPRMILAVLLAPLAPPDGMRSGLRDSSGETNLLLLEKHFLV